MNQNQGQFYYCDKEYADYYYYHQQHQHVDTTAVTYTGGGEINYEMVAPARRGRKRARADMLEFYSNESSPRSSTSSASIYSTDGDYFDQMLRAYQAGYMSKAKYKRLIANERERRRMHGLNTAFESLRSVLPNVDADNSKNYSKFETLRVALDYIVALRRLLNCQDQSSSSASSFNSNI